MLGSKLLYYLILKPLSLLPLGVLYGLSNFTYLVLYKLLGYRTKVVRENLKNSFPEKSSKEILKIERTFYLHLCDLIVEGIKAFSLTRERAMQRIKSPNVDLVNRYLDEGKNVILVGGHYGNWELYAIAIGLQLSKQPLALYTPLKNKFMNSKVKDSRSRYGLRMYSIKAIKVLINESSENYAIIFGADQSPRKTQKAYWMEFLNQDTGVQFGTEKFSKEFNAVVIYGELHRLKRGHYEVNYKLITETPNETEYGYITETHTKLLEQHIREEPAYYLWSHKRWKHKRTT